MQSPDEVEICSSETWPGCGAGSWDGGEVEGEEEETEELLPLLPALTHSQSKPITGDSWKKNHVTVMVRLTS